MVSQSQDEKRIQLENFQITSYNIWNLNPPWTDRLTLIHQQLNNLKSDIIAFQEVRYTHQKNYRTTAETHQIDDLAQGLKEYQYVYQPAMTYLTNSYDPHSDWTDEGIAIFSKHPIIESSYIKLSRNFSDREDEHQRLVLRALIEMPIGKVNVFSTHMSLSELARRRNVIEFWDFVNRYEGAQIILGDFNCEPDSETYQFLVGNKEINGVTGNFKDAWVELHGNDKEKEGWTYITLNENPKKRIDFVLYRGDLLPQSIQVLENDDKNIQPSDHRALFADFSIKKSGT